MDNPRTGFHNYVKLITFIHSCQVTEMTAQNRTQVGPRTHEVRPVPKQNTPLAYAQGVFCRFYLVSFWTSF